MSKKITRLKKWGSIPSVTDYSQYCAKNAAFFKARDEKRLLAEFSA